MKESSSISATSTLLVLVLDVSPWAWGDREDQRAARDAARLAQGKRSMGPAVLEEVLQSVQAMLVAAVSMEQSAGIVVMGVAGPESAILFPRQDALQKWLQSGPGTYTPNVRQLPQDLLTGVAELVQRATQSTVAVDSYPAAMAAAFSKALCLIQRLEIAAQSGLGVAAALRESAATQYMQRSAEDEAGVVALMNHSKSQHPSAASRQSVWSPRIFLVQASPDRSRDYNAFMNCAFAAAKQHIVVDGCYLSSDASAAASSAFLEQACDLTGGVFLAPTGAAQVGGALTAVWFAVFLAPIPCRHQLNLPALHQVDFRARCFETNETVDMAYVCNQCLSIFKHRPQTAECSTCLAPIVGNEKFRTNHTHNTEGR
jgi:transcription initiation factor TFIIH subunit 3